MNKTTQKKYSYHDIFVPVIGEKYHQVASIRAQAGDYVTNQGAHYYYHFGTYRFPMLKVQIKKKDYKFYKELPHVKEEKTEFGLIYKLTDDTIRIEVKTLTQFLSLCAERSHNELIGLEDLLKIKEIMGGNPNKKDFVIFDNGGSRAFTVWEGESAKAILQHSKNSGGGLKESHVFAYVIDGREVINNIPYFLK